MNLRLFITLCNLILFVGAGYSQGNLTLKSIDWALEHEDNFKPLLRYYCYQFPDQPVFIAKKIINYTFKVDQENKKLTAEREEETHYMTYVGDRYIVNDVTKDQNSEVNYVILDRKHGPNRPDLVFKDVEIGSIFYHDLKKAEYKFRLGKYYYGGYYYGDNTKIVFTSKSYNDCRYLTNETLVEYFPTLYQEINFDIPEGVDIDLTTFNLPEENFIKTEVPSKEGKTITYKVYIQDGVEQKKNNPGGRFIYPHILITPHSFMTNGQKVNVFESVGDLYSWYHSLVQGMKQNTSVFQQTLTDVLKGKKTEEEKIKAIYYWVQDNVRYVAYEDGIAGYQPKPAEDVFLKRYGDCKGMANLLKMMLISQGYDARLTWLGTNIVPYNYDVHSLASDNHMICTLFFKGKKYFLDPTEKYAALGENAQRIQGRQVMIEDGENYIIETIPETGISDDKISRKYYLKLTDNKLTGKVRLDYSGEGKRIYLNAMNNLRVDFKDRALENLISKKDDDVFPTDVTSSDLENRESDIEIDANVEIYNKIIDANTQKYVLLNIIKDDFFSFKIDTTRKHGYDFKLKGQFDVYLDLEVPYKTKISNLPESFTVENELFTYLLTTEVKRNKISVHKKVLIHKPVLEAKEIKNWNEAILKLNKELNKAIVLN